jgi:hypothetical protein
VIEARFGLSERQARRGAAEAAQLTAEVLDFADAEELVVQIINVQRDALDHLAEMLDGDFENESAKVGAIRTAGSLGVDVHQTLVRVGLLPDNGSRLRLDAEIEAAVKALVAVAKDLGIDRHEILSRLQEQPPIAFVGAPG